MANITSFEGSAKMDTGLIHVGNWNRTRFSEFEASVCGNNFIHYRTATNEDFNFSKLAIVFGAHAHDRMVLQCCNDVVHERYAPELKYDTALRLAALHIHQHAISNNIPYNKVTVKSIE